MGNLLFPRYPEVLCLRRIRMQKLPQKTKESEKEEEINASTFAIFFIFCTLLSALIFATLWRTCQ